MALAIDATSSATGGGAGPFTWLHTCAGSTEPGASSTTMSWSNSTSQAWAIAAVPVKPVSGGGGSFQAAWAVGSNILLRGAA